MDNFFVLRVGVAFREVETRNWLSSDNLLVSLSQVNRFRVIVTLAAAGSAGAVGAVGGW